MAKIINRRPEKPVHIFRNLPNGTIFQIAGSSTFIKTLKTVDTPYNAVCLATGIPHIFTDTTKIVPVTAEVVING